jgi:predicted Zn-ribbon and HTH transcriptional regulator
MGFLVDQQIQEHLNVITANDVIMAKYLLTGHECKNCGYVNHVVNGTLSCSFTYKDTSIKVCIFWKPKR